MGPLFVDNPPVPKEEKGQARQGDKRKKKRRRWKGRWLEAEGTRRARQVLDIFITSYHVLFFPCRRALAPLQTWPEGEASLRRRRSV